MLRGQSKQRKQRMDDPGGAKLQAGEAFPGTSPSSSIFDIGGDQTGELNLFVSLTDVSTQSSIDISDILRIDLDTIETASISRKEGLGESVSMNPSLLDFFPMDTKSTTSGTVSAVKRIFTAILPSGNESKVCQDLWPPNEHPQIPPPNSQSSLLLALVDQTSPTLLEERSISEAAMARQCANEKLVEALSAISILRSIPDVFILDQEITSIIAYALACVILHTLFTLIFNK